MLTPGVIARQVRQIEDHGDVRIACRIRGLLLLTVSHEAAERRVVKRRCGLKDQVVLAKAAGR
jgi:hypothetical protein